MPASVRWFPVSRSRRESSGIPFSRMLSRKSRRANDPFLRFVHREPFVPPDRIRAIDQSVAHFLEFRPKVRLVRPLIIATPLPAARLPKGEPQILRLDHLFKQVADSLRFIALSFAAAAPFAPLTPASAGAGLRRPRCDSVF